MLLNPKSTLILIACAIGIESFGQSQADYEALQGFLSPDKLSNIQANPERYAQMAYLNRHGYHVSPTAEKSVEGFADVSEITAIYPGVPVISLELAESQELNLMAYSLNINRNQTTYFRFGNSGKVLVIPPYEMTLRNANLLSE